MAGDPNIDEVVRRCGWFAAMIANATPPFLYSIGLMKTYGHPELIVFGLESSLSHTILSALVGHIAEGGQLRAKDVIGVELPDKTQTVGIRTVHPTQHSIYLGYATGYARENQLGALRAFQVLWSDRAGRFPYDAGCEEKVYLSQPRIDIGLTDEEQSEFEQRWQ